MSLDSRKPIRVLFVEDMFDQALLVKAFLSSAGGYEVVHTQDGDQGVQLLRDEKWDLVVTDLNLPGTDGFEVIREARAKDASLPILATTGYTEAEYHNRSSREGASKVLTKPLDKTVSLKTVWGPVADNAAPLPPSDAVLAIGGIAGDAEMGCGGGR